MRCVLLSFLLAGILCLYGCADTKNAVRIETIDAYRAGVWVDTRTIRAAGRGVSRPGVAEAAARRKSALAGAVIDSQRTIMNMIRTALAGVCEGARAESFRALCVAHGRVVAQRCAQDHSCEVIYELRHGSLVEVHAASTMKGTMVCP